jgi:hypothetical protein
MAVFGLVGGMGVFVLREERDVVEDQRHPLKVLQLAVDVVGLVVVGQRLDRLPLPPGEDPQLIVGVREGLAFLQIGTDFEGFRQMLQSGGKVSEFALTDTQIVVQSSYAFEVEGEACLSVKCQGCLIVLPF